MPVCTATVRRTRMGHILLLFESTGVPVTKRNALHRTWWFDRPLPKASARSQLRQLESNHLPFPSEHHHLQRVACPVILARDCGMSLLFRESSVFRPTSGFSLALSPYFRNCHQPKTSR